MLFVSRPYHLSDEEADNWMRSHAAAIKGAGPITGVEMSRLGNAAGSGRGHWDWMIEIHCEGVEDATRVARTEPLRDLVGDLRLLGMRPRLVLADRIRPLGP